MARRRDSKGRFLKGSTAKKKKSRKSHKRK
jgi:hypothetical protein